MYTSSRKRGGNILKKTIKIISVIFLIILLNSIVLINSVQATEQKNIAIYSKGELKRIIRYNGIAVKTTHAVYKENGIEYPAYCLNKDLNGVGEYIATYDVLNQGKITNLDLWRVIINGYPYKSIEQLGVENEAEAYIATKQAIYCYIYNRGTENYSEVGESGSRVINAMNIILENAKNSTETFENQNIEIKQDKDWQQEDQYISKEYEVYSKINFRNYIVSLENQPSDCKIISLEGQEKNEFNSNEKFKILIPISSLEETGKIKIKIQAQMETKPVFWGKAPSSDLQDYALTAYSYEDVNTELNDYYPKNETEIIIEKQDSETDEPLKGAQFEILNSNKKVVDVLETNSKGQINFKSIIPGTYYIKEIKAPDGYEGNQELQKIEIKLNEKQTIKVKNNKIVIEEEQPKEEIPKQEEPVIEIPKLPVTGM